MAENRKNGTDAENGADNNAERCVDAIPEPRAVHRAETCADAGAVICVDVRAVPFGENHAVICADRFAGKNGRDAVTGCRNGLQKPCSIWHR